MYFDHFCPNAQARSSSKDSPAESPRKLELALFVFPASGSFRGDLFSIIQFIAIMLVLAVLLGHLRAGNFFSKLLQFEPMFKGDREPEKRKTAKIGKLIANPLFQQGDSLGRVSNSNKSLHR